MKRVNFAILAIASAFFLATSVIAPPQAVSGETGQKVTAKTDSDGHIETRIKKLHSELKIKPEQEDLWNKVTQVMRENHKQMEELTKARAQNEKNMTAVEDFKSYSEITDAHAAGLKRFIPAFEALYESMSEEQKKNADISFRKHGPKRSKSKKTK